MYLSPVGALREAVESKCASVETVCSEGFGFRCSVRAASKVEISPPSNYPERRRLLSGAGRITVDAREKE
jgi:hypothetical protein